MVYNQVKKSPVIKKIIIATSSSKSDNSVEVFAKKKILSFIVEVKKMLLLDFMI